ncbi:MAG: hypothetical protein QXU82_03050 [Candidatus Aenigmatarchaeota archaeon]
MDIDEIFETFGVETERAIVIDRVYVPNSVTISELTNYSRRKGKAINMVRRGLYISIINSVGWMKKEHRHLSKESKKLIYDALSKADIKNAGYSGQ